MIKKLLLLLVLLMTVATNTWAVADRLYLDVSGTSATLKYGPDYDGKPSYSSGTWYDIGVFNTTVQTITTDASCANYSGTLQFLFSEFTALTSVDLSGLNTANVTAINSMFNSCSSLTSVDLSGLNTANVTVMNNLFGYCTSLTSVNLSGLNTSKVTNMGSLFSDCSSLTSVDLSSWDTSSATKMGNMFYGCSALTSVNLSSFNTSNVDGMARMFNSCSSLTTLDLSSFNTSKVYTMLSMFNGCSLLESIYVGDGWNTDNVTVTNSNGMFGGCTKLPNYDSGKTDKTNANTGEGGYLKLKPKTYKVTLQEGTEDAEKWTIDPTEAAEGAPVTATYSGEKKVKSVKAVKKAADPLAVPLTIEAITAGSINVSNPKEGMQYSKNGGAKTAATTSIDVAAGDKVQFYGNGTSITSYKGTSINGSGNGFTCKVYGNIMSLVDETGFATATTLSGDYTFYRLFYENTTLTDASGLLLPATELAPDCYDQMFMNCTPLTTAPVLPATTLVEKCYYRMFYNCIALTAAPELPATKLAADCYNQMFTGCTVLTTAPVLPATQLAEYCYYYMFYGCGALTAAPELPATQLAESCYNQMFRGCTSLTAAPALPATQLAERCYQQMFMDCTALTAAPALPATQMVSNCYRQMFSNCIALTASPELPATQLVSGCYNQMFYNCRKLATVTCLATSGINLSGSTTSWLSGAGSQAQGIKTFNAVSTANWPPSNSGIPDGWQRVNVDN